MRALKWFIRPLLSPVHEQAAWVIAAFPRLMATLFQRQELLGDLVAVDEVGLSERALVGDSPIPVDPPLGQHLRVYLEGEAHHLVHRGRLPHGDDRA